MIIKNMFKKALILAVFAVFFSVLNIDIVLADNSIDLVSTSTDTVIATSSATTTEDVFENSKDKKMEDNLEYVAGLENETIPEENVVLPTSYFYMFTNFSRGIQRLFTFNSYKKIDLELKISNEKILEIKKLVNTMSDRKDLISVSIRNYELSRKRIGSWFVGLGNSAQDERQKVKIIGHLKAHEAIFLNLKIKFVEDKTIIDQIWQQILAIRGVLKEGERN